MGGFQWKLQTFFYIYWRCTPIQMLYEIWLFSIVLVSHIEKWILSYHTWGGTHHLSTIPPWLVNGFQWNMCKSTAKWSDLRRFSPQSMCKLQQMKFNYTYRYCISEKHRFFTFQNFHWRSASISFQKCYELW